LKDRRQRNLSVKTPPDHGMRPPADTKAPVFDNHPGRLVMPGVGD
jgi:hypothetical protein